MNREIGTATISRHTSALTHGRRRNGDILLFYTQVPINLEGTMKYTNNVDVSRWLNEISDAVMSV